MKNTFTKIITFIISVILLIVVIAVTYSGIKTSGFQHFNALEHNGTTITATTKQIRFQYGRNAFTVKAMLPFQIPQIYEVTVTSNPESNLTFLKDGEQFSFARLGDLTKYFGVETNSTEFFVTVSNEYYSMQAFLNAVYPGTNIELPDSPELKDYFILSVSLSGGETIRVYFCIDFSGFTLSIDPPNIIF